VLAFFGSSQLVVGKLYGWRTKAKLALRGQWQRPKIGLFRSSTHEVESISDCLAHHPSINQAIKVLKEAICKEKILLYDEKKGILRYAQFFVELTTNKVQLVLVVRSQDPSFGRLCAHLLKSDLWHSIWLNVQPERNNRILGERWIFIWGEKFLWQGLGGQTFPFHPGAFSQAHWTLFEQLAKQVVEWVPNGSKLLEIYAGVGSMGMLAAHKCKSVDLVENNLCSYVSFQEKKVSMEAIASVTYHFGDAKLGVELLSTTDCLIIDPPRKGIDSLLLKSIQTFTGTLIYVSCDFRSFSRDMTRLRESGWELKESKGYLLFPGTNHVEITAKYERS
jgi:tRNA/tmRNA/rRNA uracil-C5-methylase (TrmA/RlmC/RlmD family)